MLVARHAPKLVHEGMSRDPAVADDHTGMLDRSVLIEEPGTHGTDLPAQARADQLRDQITALGWEVKDTPKGPQFVKK